MVKTLSLLASDPQVIERAVDVLDRGGLVAIPTDTVYGLAASVAEPAGVTALYQVKGRPLDKSIPILIGDVAALNLIARVDDERTWRVARAFWPGPLTLVVARHPDLPEAVSRTDSVGVRIPDHPLAGRLLRRSGPLAVTSANRSGGPESITAGEVMAALGGRIQMIIDDGRCPGGRPSTVIDCTGYPPRLLRQGPIALQAVLAVMAGGA
jgi:L-threonylcarbamoyladenylate synthase